MTDNLSPLGAALSTPPTSLSATRVALHRLATYVIAPERYRSTGRFGLRATPRGFGTPVFGDNRQVRVEGVQLVDQRAATTTSASITTLQAGADFLGAEIDTETAAEHDSPPVGDVDAPLDIDPAAADFLASWFAMAFDALEQVRADGASVDASEPQLWPGHFDPAIEVGDEDHRGSYGASPGDHSIDEPYLYVSLWWPDRLNLDADDPVLNAPSFTGAVLKLSDFDLAGTDPVAQAVEFFRSTRDHVTG